MENGVVLEVLPDAGKLDLGFDPSALQQLTRTDTTQLQKLWAVDSACGKNYLLVRLHCGKFVISTVCLARSKHDACGFVSIELDLGNL